MAGRTLIYMKKREQDAYHI